MAVSKFLDPLKDFSFGFIQLPNLPIYKIENLKTIVEKWCYFLKYAVKTSEADLQKIIGSDIVIERAYEALNQFNWNETELIAYEQEIKRIMDNRSTEDYLIDKRKEIEAIEIAKEMLADNEPIAKIIKYTALTLEQIEKLKSS